MSEGAVAERYAQALLELGQEEGGLESLASSMRSFAQAFDGSRELRSVLLDPTIGSAEREALIRAISARISMPELGVKGLLVLARRRRLGSIGAISRRLTELSDQATGVLRGTVTTAQQMPESFYEALAAGIASATGRRILLSRTMDESLIGGAVATVGDTTIDASIRGQLADIERELMVAVGGDA